MKPPPGEARASGDSLLEVKDLVTRIPIEGGGEVSAVSHVSFSMARGESLALVGESGSGKSMTALSILGLLPQPGRVTSGQAWFNGRDIVALPRERAAKGPRAARSASSSRTRPPRSTRFSPSLDSSPMACANTSR